jgi:hypothetical protein
MADLCSGAEKGCSKDFINIETLTTNFKGVRLWGIPFYRYFFVLSESIFAIPGIDLIFSFQDDQASTYLRSRTSNPFLAYKIHKGSSDTATNL